MPPMHTTHSWSVKAPALSLAQANRQFMLWTALALGLTAVNMVILINPNGEWPDQIAKMCAILSATITMEAHLLFNFMRNRMNATADGFIECSYQLTQTEVTAQGQLKFTVLWKDVRHFVSPAPTEGALLRLLLYIEDESSKRTVYAFLLNPDDDRTQTKMLACLKQHGVPNATADATDQWLQKPLLEPRQLTTLQVLSAAVGLVLGLVMPAGLDSIIGVSLGLVVLGPTIPAVTWVAYARLKTKPTLILPYIIQGNGVSALCFIGVVVFRIYLDL